MSLSISTLTNYTEENKQALITKALFASKTISMMTPMTGIKSAETINILDTDAVFQAGGTCGFSASGTTAITQRTVTVGKVKVQEALCPKTLETKYTQLMLQAGSQYEKIPFEKLYAEYKADQISKAMETAIWQGDTTSGTNNLSYFDGLIKNIGKVYSATGIVNNNAITGTGTVSTAVATDVVTGVGTAFVTQGIAAGDKLRIGGAYYEVLTVDSATQITLTANAGVLNAGVAFTFTPVGARNYATPYTSISASNALDIFQSIYLDVPIEILDKDDLRVFCGWDTFRLLQQDITDGKYFHYTAEAASGEMVLPGTNLKIVAVNGLNSTNRIFAMRTSNMYYGTDLMNEEEKFKIFFAEEADEIRYMAEWKAGCNVAFPSHIVQFTLA